MSKGLIFALIIMGLAALVFIFTKGHTEVNLLFTEVKTLTSIALLVSMAFGVIIGVSLK